MKILLIAYRFSPYNSIGAVRTGKMARHWISKGHEVRVLSAADLPLLQTLPLEIPAENVIRTRRLNLNFLPEMAFGGQKKVAKKGYKTKSSLLKRLGFLYRTLLHFPDEDIGWLPFAEKAGMKLLRDWPADLIYASAGPTTALIIAQHLSQRTGIPWVGELRDLWVDNHHYEYPEWRRKLETRLEHSVFKSASGLVTVSEPWAKTLAKKFNGPVRVVYNGYDPMDYPAPQDLVPAAPDLLRIVYTGTVYPSFQDVNPLFVALRLLGPAAETVRVVFHCRYMDAVQAQAEREGVGHLVEAGGLIPYHLSLKAQMEADILLLLLWGRMDQPDETGFFPAKLFEYIGAGRPILALGIEKDLATQLIRQRGAGFVSNEPEKIAKQLQFWLHQKQTLGSIPGLQAAAQQGLSRQEQYNQLELFLTGLVHSQQRVP